MSKRTDKRHQDSEEESVEMRNEYDFSAGKRGVHAARYAEGTNVVVLDADVAAVFPTPQAVNTALRGLASLLRQVEAQKASA